MAWVGYWIFGIRPHCVFDADLMVAVLVARIGFSATTSRESRQGRKAAAAAAMSGAGVSADAGHLQV